MKTLEADYLVVGAGAMGMAFTDALIDHADVRVILVDRRPGAGGHWLDAYPFVRLHQASAFYGVASTLLGGGRIQTEGPEAGLHERATAPEIQAYYDGVLRQKLLGSGKVAFYPGVEHIGGRELVSLETQERFEVSGRTRIVDARYLAPQIPALTPPPFAVAEGARVLPVNDLPALGELPSQVVVVGAGKTATDACIWLLDNGLDPGAICWVRPRDPWMFDRAVLQPDPVVFLGMATSIMNAASEATDHDDMFLRLESAGVMLRIDPAVTPTMAKTPTLARWELDRLRTIEHVVRLGHLQQVEQGKLLLDNGEVPIDKDALVVHCAAAGLKYPPLIPIWDRETITLQPVRNGFPSFGAAVIGFVEATLGDDGEKNGYCMPSPYSNTPLDWARMMAIGGRSSMALTKHPEIRAWVDGVALNPARIPPELAGSTEVAEAADRFRSSAQAGAVKMAQLAGLI